MISSDVRDDILQRLRNVAFVEWIQSPIIYAESSSFAADVRQLLPDVYSCESGICHYRSMARTNFRGYLKGDMVPLKKYFYVLRPLLAVRWLERYGTPAPIEFGKLLHLIDDQSLLADVDVLLTRKRAAPEMSLDHPVASINAFIERELKRLEAIVPTSFQRPDVLSSLNQIFHRSLQ